VLTGISPILLVTDLERSLAWWQESVGFDVEKLDENFGAARRDDLVILMARSPQPSVYWQVVENMWNVYIRVEDVDAFCAEVQERGAELDYSLCNQPWGMREFGLQDPDGHDIGFGQPIRPA
jgi:uncharacterized glyoxalase superfamily protein PhnB